MIILLSPAKTLDFKTPAIEKTCTEPEFLSLSKRFNRRVIQNVKRRDFETYGD